MRVQLLPRVLVWVCLGFVSVALAQDSQTVDDRSDEARPSAGKAVSDEPRISALDIEVDGQQMRLSFKLLHAFDDNLKRRIDSGLYSGFLFDIELVRARKSWFNKNLDAGSLQVVAMYNAVTREYLINFRHDGDLIDSRVVKDVAELEQALTEFDALDVFSVEGLNERQRLRVRVRANLGTRTVFFFIPKTISTDWEESPTFRLAELDR